MTRRARVRLLLFLLLVWSCSDQSVTAFRLQEVVGPTGGDVLTVTVAANGKIIALSESHLFGWDEQKQVWVGRRGVGFGGLGEDDVPFRSILLDGLSHNYPRNRMLTSWNGAIWLMTRHLDRPTLLFTDTAGARWQRVALPEEVEPAPTEEQAEDENSEQEIPAPVPAVRAAEPLRILGSQSGLFLIGTRDVWKFDGSVDEPSWASIGTDGLPRDSPGLPPAIRNYLPASEQRPFEMITVLAEQLLVFRRTAPDEPWVMVSTLTTVDRELLGTPAGDTVFIVAPDSIRRSDDQGERWFRFWPEGQPSPETALIVPGEKIDAGYLLVIGAADGSIWLSLDGGGSWQETRPSDPDRRAISGLAASGNELWASTMGLGMLRSADGGHTWHPRNVGLRATRPARVTFTGGGDLLYAARSGLHRLAGDPDSGAWATIHERATVALHVEPTTGRTVAGTTTGDLTMQSDEGEPIQVPNPFGKRTAFEFVPPQLTRGVTPPQAVVDIAARDDGQRWLAWSRKYGAAASEDGGVSWRPLELSDALVGALASTTVTELVVDPGETIYLLEESADSRSPALLWRSTDNGQSWTTVHAFERTSPTRVIVRPRPPNYPGVLFAAHGGTLLRSTSYGEQWEHIDGPWAGQRIVDFHVAEDRLVLLIDTRRQYEVVVVDDLGAKAPSTRRHVVFFPDGERPDYGDITGFEAHERRVIITNRDRVWIGNLPSRRGGIPDGMAMLATLAGAVVLIAGAYLFMRSVLADSR